MSYLEPVERKRSIVMPMLRRDLQERVSAARRRPASFLLPLVVGILIGGLGATWFNKVNTGGSASTNRLPEGWVDEIGPQGFITGWARDLDTLGKPVTIRVYFNGPEGVGTDSLSIVANQFRPDWNAWAFKIAIPQGKRNGIRHSVHVYAVDVNSSKDETVRLGVRDVTLLKAAN
jgi:hypothetical protein